MDKDALTALGSRVDEVKDLVGHFILRVEKNLVLLVHPVEGEVGNANALPHVANRVTRAVHDMGYFVRYNEFQVLPQRFKV